ncbi:unnamed protein product, partial [Polarella glacialis]
ACAAAPPGTTGLSSQWNCWQVESSLPELHQAEPSNPGVATGSGSQRSHAENRPHPDDFPGGGSRSSQGARRQSETPHAPWSKGLESADIQITASLDFDAEFQRIVGTKDVPGHPPFRETSSLAVPSVPSRAVPSGRARTAEGLRAPAPGQRREEAQSPGSREFKKKVDSRNSYLRFLEGEIAAQQAFLQLHKGIRRDQPGPGRSHRQGRRCTAAQAEERGTSAPATAAAQSNSDKPRQKSRSVERRSARASSAATQKVTLECWKIEEQARCKTSKEVPATLGVVDADDSWGASSLVEVVAEPQLSVSALEPRRQPLPCEQPPLFQPLPRSDNLPTWRGLMLSEAEPAAACGRHAAHVQPEPQGNCKFRSLDEVHRVAQGLAEVAEFSKRMPAVPASKLANVKVLLRSFGTIIAEDAARAAVAEQTYLRATSTHWYPTQCMQVNEQQSCNIGCLYYKHNYIEFQNYHTVEATDLPNMVADPEEAVADVPCFFLHVEHLLLRRHQQTNTLLKRQLSKKLAQRDTAERGLGFFVGGWASYLMGAESAESATAATPSLRKPAVPVLTGEEPVAFLDGICKTLSACDGQEPSWAVSWDEKKCCATAEVSLLGVPHKF